MKIIILKSNLKEGLDTVGRSVGTNANLPVLGNVLIKTQGGDISLSTTNLELATTKKVAGKVISEGSITVPFATLSSVINNLATERINLEAKENNLVIKTDNYNATLQGLDEKEFPIIPSIKEEKEYLQIEEGLLKEALTKTAGAAEVTDLRPEISGVLFTLDSNILKIVATDSFRLAEATISSKNIENNFERGLTITVPLKTAQELARVLGEEGKIKVLTDETQIVFESKELKLVSRLIEGKFPDYQAIIPKETDTQITANREELINGIKLAGSFSGRNSEVNVAVKNNKTIEIYSGDSRIGENKYIIAAQVDGPDTEIAFNWHFFLEGLRNEDSKEVVLKMNGEERPTVIQSPQSSDYFYILMPIKP